jgi:hypothetical protein
VRRFRELGRKALVPTLSVISALILGEILAETELPAGAFSILPMKSKDADALVEGMLETSLLLAVAPERVEYGN